jgi:hypothetical protein
MTVVVKNDTLRDIETRAATTRLHFSCSNRNLDSSAFAKEGNSARHRCFTDFEMSKPGRPRSSYERCDK